MFLGDQLSKMSLHRMDGDPVVDALKRGSLPTLGDVKRSLKVYLTLDILSSPDSSHGPVNDQDVGYHYFTDGDIAE
ncbi:hypothetical protein JVT61DRAFT_2262 [Boletus reticuloceps]|uniref:Uncharacterized protein n=1 Tax=Boletus reticuloceps TaxID=495285 RepID=A0A8I2YNN1_9AGAM|nr:hypothetical protein JVT61DRAFT_2262 [Boletus reticuloceps]